MSKVSHNRQGGNNFSCRVTVLIFTILAIGCAACANIFPVLKKESDAAKVKQTLWYNQTTVSGGVGTKVDVSESLCGQYKLFFQASEGAAVGAAGIGLVVLGLAIAQLILEEKSSRFTCCAASLISLAFAACGACVALIVYGYMRGYCQSDAVLSSQYGPLRIRATSFPRPSTSFAPPAVFFCFPASFSAVRRSKERQCRTRPMDSAGGKCCVADVLFAH
ncbi:hypothetical protein TcBrA4_0122000 [Trypanosoma cruzi]|nr:hypothetical protein TcBrA4_0122000 [Trypanosoma cruzi]